MGEEKLLVLQLHGNLTFPPRWGRTWLNISTSYCSVVGFVKSDAIHIYVAAALLCWEHNSPSMLGSTIPQ